VNEQPVVVVGAGPAGLATAITLARSGIGVRLLERRTAGFTAPRATVVSLRSMEVLRSWGLEDRVRAGSDRVEMTMLVMPDVARAEEGTVVDVGYPTSAHSAVLSPTEALCVAQDHLESVLLEHLSTLPLVTVERGREVVGVTADASSAVVTARDTTGRLTSYDARYVVGADGARSAVRDAAGIRMHGQQVVYQGSRVQFHAALWQALGDHRHLLYAVTDPAASGVLLPAGQGDRWEFGVAYGSEDTDMVDPPTDTALVQRLLRATGLSRKALRVTRFGTFSAGAQLAESFSRGPLFLVGDAAHRVTPRGGTGLNIAFADGYHLGWKMGWVLREWAPPSLLDSYESERRPAVEHNVHRSADPAGSRRPAAAETYVDLGGRIPHRWVAPGRSTIDLAGDGFMLLTAGDAPDLGSAPRTVALPPLATEQLDSVTAQSLGLGTTGAVLLRPDALPVAAWSGPPSAGAVLDAAASFLTGPRAGTVFTDTAA
jgi:2-polyprenyl-6-methoxyphenol hydroxylase-like FAD-dependent oxidoreductase